MIFMVIIITKPEFFDGEAQRISKLLLEGTADLIHIRKPEASQHEVEQLLKAIPSVLYSRLVLHDCHQLALKYGLRGIHLNARNPQPPVGWQGSVVPFHQRVSTTALSALRLYESESYLRQHFEAGLSVGIQS